MEEREWVRIGVALALFVVAFAISWIAVRLLGPLVDVGAFLVLAYLVTGFGIGYFGLRGIAGIIWAPRTILVIVGSVVFAALVVYILHPLIEVLAILGMSWIIWKWSLKEWASDVSAEIERYLWEE